MASGVTFWQYPDEEEAFLEFLESTGNVVAIPSLLVDNEVDLLPQPMRGYIMRFDPDQVLLGLDNHASQRIIEPVVVEGRNRICASSATSCLVCYRRGKYRNHNKLGQFNLSASWERLNDSKTILLEKDPGFRKWAEKLFRWIRKHTPEWHQYKGYRVTRRVKESLDNGSLEIVP